MFAAQVIEIMLEQTKKMVVYYNGTLSLKRAKHAATCYLSTVGSEQ
jgi:hypothetical protein